MKENIDDEKNNITKAGNEEENPEIPQEILDKLPPEDRVRIEKSLSIMTMGSFRRHNPLEKITTSEHLTKIIDNADKESDREYRDKQISRIFVLLYIIIAAIVFVGLTYLLKNNPEMFKLVIPPITTLIAGSFAGFGFGYKSGYSKGKNSD